MFQTTLRKNILMNCGIRCYSSEIKKYNHVDGTPHQTRTVYLPNPNKKKVDILTFNLQPKTQSFQYKLGPRTNDVHIQMISRTLHKQIFKNTKNTKVDPCLIEQCKRTLERHNMLTKEADYVQDINFKLPPLRGESLEEHFFNIGEEQAAPYRNIVLKLLKGIPEAPKVWIMQEGWTRYVPNEKPKQVPYPAEHGIVFDVEVCVRSGKAPTLATAVSNEAWYGWVSQSLIDTASKPVTTNEYTLDALIPIESTKNDNGLKLNEFLLKPKVVVGHNVAYDRARIKEQYWLERTGTRFIDTMSLHTCVSGMTSYQRAILKSGKESEEDIGWISQSSLNSLEAVYKLYCGESVDKETRGIFVTGSLDDIHKDFQNLMKYCSLDTLATYNILSKLFPMFLERFPHPVTLAGMLELSTVYLPVNSNWSRYIEDSEQTYDDLHTESRLLLAKRADQACQLLHGSKYNEDLWMWDQNWEVKDFRLIKAQPKQTKQNLDNVEDEVEEVDPLEEKFRYLFEQRLPARANILAGYPAWYKKLCNKPEDDDWIPGPHLISTGMQVTPKLLKLTWEGYPLHFIRGKGWGFLIPFTEDIGLSKQFPLVELLKKCPIVCNKPNTSDGTKRMDTIANDVQEFLAKREYYSRVKKDKTGGAYKGTGVWCDTVVDDCCYFLKLPHKDGASHRVGNPLAKDFLNKLSENVLAGDTESAEQVLAIARMLSYWRNNRDRIKDQMVVWLDHDNLPKNLRDKSKFYGAILPQVVVCGTLTRRAVEPTWMTASNAYKERLGSELRSMVQAPPGYNIVGADVDSQELWIASVLGDANFARTHGGTPLGWMTLSGNKSKETDMHSVTAKAVGISRDHAKVLNYARIYGAGQNFAESLLKQFNPSMSDGEARSKAQKMFTLTKGKRIYHLKQEFLADFADQPYSQWQAYEMAKLHGKKIEEMFHKPKWVGGTESAMFNRLEEIANMETPRTPFLNCQLSRALEIGNNTDNDRFLPTRVNWVVQSGAVDFLHLMLVSMRWILKDKARFSLSFHDEVRYLVKEDFRYKAALALHVTNLFTRSFCSIKLGLNDLPQSIAFFSSVEVDTVLRKEAKHDCATPSNPHGLEKGYGIPNGETLDIVKAIEKAGGKFWYNINGNVKSNKTKAHSVGNDPR